MELDSDDRVHHHSLGMVRRLWIEDKVRNLISDGRLVTPEEILNGIAELSEMAFYNFQKTRDLDPADDHGYITDMQLSLYIIERLVRATPTEKISDLTNRYDQVGDWVRKRLNASVLSLTLLYIWRLWPECSLAKHST